MSSIRLTDHFDKNRIDEKDFDFLLQCRLLRERDTQRRGHGSQDDIDAYIFADDADGGHIAKAESTYTANKL